MAVTGVWLGPDAGAAASLANGAAWARAGSGLSAGGAGEVAGGAVDGGVESMAAGDASASGGKEIGFAIDSIAGSESGTCAIGTFFLRKGFAAGAVGFTAAMAGAGVALRSSGGGREMLRVTNVGAGLAEAGGWPKLSGGWRSTAACASTTSAASMPSVRQGGADAGAGDADTALLRPGALRRRTARRASAGP